MAYPYYPYYSQYTPQYSQSYLQEYETMRWVDGEIGAKAFQKPPELPANKPIALWDSTEKKIYLKSWNQMGMANPLQELTYTIKEEPAPIVIDGMSGETNKYATKEDLELIKEELKNISRSIQSVNSNKNRGGQN